MDQSAIGASFGQLQPLERTEVVGGGEDRRSEMMLGKDMGFSFVNLDTDCIMVTLVFV